MKRALFILLCCFLMSLIGIGVYAYATHLLSTSEAIDSLKNRSSNELFSEINGLDESSIESGDAAIYAEALSDAIKEFPAQKIENMIKNDKNSTILRVMLLQLAKELNIKLDYRNMTCLLTDPGIDNDIKYNIIINIGVSHENSDILEYLIQGDDDYLAFQSLKMLFINDKDKWYPIAREILNNRKQARQECLKAVLLEMGAWINAFGTAEMIPDYIRDCDKILRSNAYGTEIIDSAFYSLCDLQSCDSIQYILSSELFPNEKKVYAVSENVEALSNTLCSEPSIKDLETVLLAIQYYPKAELLKPLQHFSGKIAVLYPELSYEKTIATEQKISDAIKMLNDEYGE